VAEASALDLIASDHFSQNEKGVFAPLHGALLKHGDHYMHLADLRSYLEADPRVVRGRGRLAQEGDCERRRLSKFSSDQAIARYSAEIWNATPCPAR
jgi:starch phosphorylase